MRESVLQRQKSLQALAQKDAIYQTWAKSYALYRNNFAAFANSQPEHIRTMLWGYAESGRLMQQRLVNLACETMDFPEKNR